MASQPEKLGNEFARQSPRYFHQQVLDRSSLPAPIAYLTQNGLLTRQPRSEWASINCPVHKDGRESNPSMRVNLIDGHFRCMACGASGGDLVSLHRLRTGMNFRQAVADLTGRFYDH